MKNTFLAAALIAVLPVAANAAVFTAQVSGAPGATVTLSVTYTGDGATAEAQTDLDFSNANIAITNPVIQNGATNCLVVSPTKLRILAPSGGSQPLPAGPIAYCNFTVAISAMAPEALIPFTASNVECFNTMGGASTCTLAPGSGVNVANTPVPRTLGYNPTAGSTITFAAGTTVGAAAPAQTIAVTATGTSGTATLAGCAISGAGAAAFNVAPTSLTFNTSNTQNLSVGCNYPTSNATATLTCTETDGDTPAPGAARTFNLSCPAPTVNPTISSVPASGSTVSVPGGIAGTQSTGLIDFSAAGGAGAGSTAISCTSTGTVQIAANPGTPAGQGPVAQTVTTGQPTDLRFGVTLTSTGQSPAGTITCTVAGQPNFTYTVNAPAGTTVVPPTVIPSSSTWSTLALLGLLGVFGLMAVGFRRQA